MKDHAPASLRLHRTSIRDGVWEGLLTRVGEGEGVPVIELCHRDAPVSVAELTERGEEAWSVRVPIPSAALSDGVQTFTLVDQSTGLMLDSFAVSLGEPLQDDIRAEIDLLRAELDLLKRAFRRHCAEASASGADFPTD
ncbi:MAG: hypothetical protein QNJ13_15090 [Paracoccaceae bacterium]|nr:hypothetical protein [Paracoccaceae bacterium]